MKINNISTTQFPSGGGGGWKYKARSFQGLSMSHTVRLAAVALTQFSAYITHKHLAARKIIEAMCTAYEQNTKIRDSVSTLLKQNMTQMITEHTRVCGRKARIVCEENFISLNRLMNSVVKVLCIQMRHSFLYFFSLVYAFPNCCTQISRPLAYGVRISPKVARPLPGNMQVFSSEHYWEQVWSGRCANHSTGR